MSKKNKKQGSLIAAAGTYTPSAEHTVIKHDLWKVLYLNLVYLAAVLVLYFTDQKSQYLERIIGKIFHF